jgi:hypothetical protein
MKWILQALSLLVLGLFAGIWLYIGWEVWHYEPTPEHPEIAFSDAVVTVAGFMAAAVGAGTASVLGIEIQKAESGTTLGTAVNAAATASALLTGGILLYAAVGVFVLVAWLGHSDVAPDMVNAFALGVLGWLAGAFAAVFRKT